MTNLREKKKEKTRKRIQDVSLQLFQTSGYEKTTMEKIASEAEIGVGTLYNYFPSKVDLLFSIIEGNIELYMSELEEIINNEMTLQESLHEFFNIYLKSFTAYGKNVWRDLFREILFREHNGYAKIKEIDQNFIDQLYKLLCKRIVEIGINTEEKLFVASRALYSLLGFNIIYFVSDSTVSSQEMIGSLMEQVNLIVDGLIPIE
jgi:AcrR family transcriptional regulator